MFKKWMLAATVSATTLLSSAAFAVDQPANKTPPQPAAASSPTAPSPAAPSPAQRTADQAFGKLSEDGLKTFQMIRQARLAIFNAQPDKAKTDVDQAEAALKKAKSDDTAFVKAESALEPPAGMAQPNPSKGTPSSTPVAWIPVNGALTLGENYVETPEKATGVAKANEQLKKGDHKQALETLRLANVDVSFVAEVAPLDKTASGLDKASQLLNQSHYYEANEVLKTVEDGLRFDVADISVPPKGADSTKPAGMSGTSSQSGMSAPAENSAQKPMPAPSPAPSAK